MEQVTTVAIEKRCVEGGLALDDLAAHMDGGQFALASSSEDHAEGVAAFLQRRKPRFRGR
jgi:enoyl-CoA hydratase/carnithine racemase